MVTNLLAADAKSGEVKNGSYTTVGEVFTSGHFTSGYFTSRLTPLVFTIKDLVNLSRTFTITHLVSLYIMKYIKMIRSNCTNLIIVHELLQFSLHNHPLALIAVNVADPVVEISQPEDNATKIDIYSLFPSLYL